MYENLQVIYFDTEITNVEVKELLLSSQPGDLYWGAPKRPPYSFDFSATREQSVWRINSDLSWQVARASRKKLENAGVTVRLEGVEGYSDVSEGHLKFSLFKSYAGMVFKLDDEWYRITKRNIWVSSDESAELEIHLENT